MKIKFKDYEIELSMVELKEISTTKNITHKLLPVDSSSKPTVKPKTDISQNSKKITNDTIKKIKELSLEGLDNKEIAKRLNIIPQTVNYWRKNTPKDYDGNNGVV